MSGIIGYKNIFNGVVFEMTNNSGDTIEIFRMEDGKQVSPDDLLEPFNRVLELREEKLCR
jgi:hypothetical protein